MVDMNDLPNENVEVNEKDIHGCFRTYFFASFGYFIVLGFLIILLYFIVSAYLPKVIDRGVCLFALNNLEPSVEIYDPNTVGCLYISSDHLGIRWEKSNDSQIHVKQKIRLMKNENISDFTTNTFQNTNLDRRLCNENNSIIFNGYFSDSMFKCQILLVSIEIPENFSFKHVIINSIKTSSEVEGDVSESPEPSTFLFVTGYFTAPLNTSKLYICLNSGYLFIKTLISHECYIDATTFIDNLSLQYDLSLNESNVQMNINSINGRIQILRIFKPIVPIHKQNNTIIQVNTFFGEIYLGFAQDFKFEIPLLMVGGSEEIDINKHVNLVEGCEYCTYLEVGEFKDQKTLKYNISGSVMNDISQSHIRSTTGKMVVPHINIF
eukprot:TRINITY_DN820_c0_g1_i1.p1 TRINITY_DN820_c0_g1~~TRINITY_DN820_c0_g1_i1.p1  ORF type:complete len:379 (+),score=87.83 TRINITY_DN820_c0_g1_i1:108-1244(+)